MLNSIDISLGIPFEDKLRFDLYEYILKIKYGNDWLMIRKYVSKYKKIPIILEDVLFDTGNESNCCRIPGFFFEEFINDFAEIEFNPHPVMTRKSKEPIKFCFNDMVEFETYLVFFFGDVPENQRNSINIGIDALFHFISIIYPSNSDKIRNKFICYPQPTKK